MAVTCSSGHYVDDSRGSKLKWVSAFLLHGHGKQHRQIPSFRQIPSSIGNRHPSETEPDSIHFAHVIQFKQRPLSAGHVPEQVLVMHGSRPASHFRTDLLFQAKSISIVYGVGSNYRQTFTEEKKAYTSGKDPRTTRGCVAYQGLLLSGLCNPRTASRDPDEMPLK